MVAGFNIIGFSVRTTNQNNQSKEDMTQLWAQVMGCDAIAKIPNKVSSDIYAIYTDYESNYMGAYTAIIGVRVSDLDHIPEGLTGRSFPQEEFKRFTAKGSVPSSVVATWQEIWRQEESLNRKYTYDYECYDIRSQRGDQSEVDIYIAVRK